MENLPTFVLHSTKKRSIWRFLLLAGCVSSCSYREPLQQLWAGAPSQLWPHLPPHTRGFFCCLKEVLISLCPAVCPHLAAAAPVARPGLLQVPDLTWASSSRGMLVTPENVPGARGAVPGRWSPCTWGPPCATKGCSPAGQRWKAQLWRGGIAGSEQLGASTALGSFLPALFQLICFPFLLSFLFSLAFLLLVLLLILFSLFLVLF